jgi:membrane peptidoglycan carboxypeptidase
MFGATGGVFCAPLWHDYMEVVLKNEKVRPFPPEIPLRRKIQYSKGTHIMAAKAPDEDKDKKERTAELSRQVRERMNRTQVQAVQPEIPVQIRTRATLPEPEAPPMQQEQRQPVSRMEDNLRPEPAARTEDTNSAPAAPAN